MNDVFHVATRGMIGTKREGFSCTCGSDDFVALPNAGVPMAPSDILSCSRCGLAYGDTEEYDPWCPEGAGESSEQATVFVEGVHKE